MRQNKNNNLNKTLQKMKTKSFWALAACGALTMFGSQAKAQETVVVEEETAVVTDVPCKTHYYYR